MLIEFVENLIPLEREIVVLVHLKELSLHDAAVGIGKILKRQRTGIDAIEKDFEVNSLAQRIWRMKWFRHRHRQVAARIWGQSIQVPRVHPLLQCERALVRKSQPLGILS